MEFGTVGLAMQGVNTSRPFLTAFQCPT